MGAKSIIVAGIEIPSSDPVFLGFIGVHVLLALICTITGIIAMLSNKRPGRHPEFGSVYYWCLLGVLVTGSGLAACLLARGQWLIHSRSARVRLCLFRS